MSGFVSRARASSVTASSARPSSSRMSVRRLQASAPSGRCAIRESSSWSAVSRRPWSFRRSTRASSIHLRCASVRDSSALASSRSASARSKLFSRRSTSKRIVRRPKSSGNRSSASSYRASPASRSPRSMCALARRTKTRTRAGSSVPTVASVRSAVDGSPTVSATSASPIFSTVLRGWRCVAASRSQSAWLASPARIRRSASSSCDCAVSGSAVFRSSTASRASRTSSLASARSKRSRAISARLSSGAQASSRARVRASAQPRDIDLL